MNINNMINTVLEHEGGFVDHKNDKGGATNHGVTSKVYADFLGLESNYEHLTNLVKAMPKDTAKMIYKELYYYQPKIDLLPETLQPQVFDMAVNHGANRAYKLLQTALNELTGSELVIDGYFGKLSWSALDKTLSHPIDLNNNLVYTRIDFYNSIVKRDSTQNVFLNGWLKRANSFLIKSTY
jgi:lysozyme family protein